MRSSGHGGASRGRRQEWSPSERLALRLVGISTRMLLFEPRDEGNERLTELTGEHRCHG